MTNDRNKAKPRGPQLRTCTRLQASIWLASVIVVTMSVGLFK